MKLISLTHGKYSIVDDSDFEALSQYKWMYSPFGYAIRNPPRNKSARVPIRMHREILCAPKDVEVDHINCDRLDNRRENLRLCSRIENAQNREKTKRDSTSKFKGVSWDSKNNKYLSGITVLKRKINLGRFKNEVDAALAYNDAAIKYFGPFARINKV